MKTCREEMGRLILRLVLAFNVFPALFPEKPQNPKALKKLLAQGELYL